MAKRVRSPNYPSLSLREAVDKLELLRKAIGRNPSTSVIVARGMGYKGLSGTSASAISALKKYGLLEGRDEEIRLSDLAMCIIAPHSPTERQESLREAALRPDLFRELSERFEGPEVNEMLLTNYLVRRGFSEQAIAPAVSAYKDTLGFVGELDENGSREMAAHKQTAVVSHEPAVGPAQLSATSRPCAPGASLEQAGAVNSIGVQISGSLVRITALLDVNGLEKLKGKIDALITFLGDDDPCAASEADINDSLG